MVSHLRLRSFQYIRGLILHIQPIAHGLSRENNRHPVVNKCDALCRFAGQNGAGRVVAFLAVDAREIDHIVVLGRDGVLDLVFAAMLPFEIAGGGNQAAALGHAVFEDCLLRGSFAAGVEKELAVWQCVAPVHGIRAGLEAGAIGQHGDGIAGTDFAAGFRVRIAAIDGFDDLPQFLGCVVLSNIIASAHGHSPLIQGWFDLHDWHVIATGQLTGHGCAAGLAVVGGEQQVGVVHQIVVPAEHGAPGIGVAGGGGDDELSQLEENILEEGLVLMPLIVWNDTIVDGHNRYRIAQAHPGIGFRTHEKQFNNRYEALSWICKNQLGRRNLTPQQKKYLIGQRYDAEKKTHGGDRKSNLPESSGQNDHLIAAQKTRERIVSETGTSESYLLRRMRRTVWQ